MSTPQAFLSIGIAYCDLNTSRPGTYKVTFSAESSGGGARVFVSRIVTVLPSCAPGEPQCSDGTCGRDGMCLTTDVAGFLHHPLSGQPTGEVVADPYINSASSLVQFKRPPPSLSLVGSASVSVKQGAPYVRCAEEDYEATGKLRPGRWICKQ